MTTTREAALEAALKEIMSSDSYESRETFDGSNKHVVITKFGEFGQIAHDALSTPATEPQGLEREVFAIAHSCDGYGWKYIDSGSGSDWIKRGMQYQDATPLYDTPARSAPQPAADTPALHDELATMISDLSHTGELSMLYRMEIADRITALRAIIGTATPAPSDKIAEAARDVFYIDCEFDGHNGPLLSIAMVRQDGYSLHVKVDVEAQDPWVIENVMPVMDEHQADDFYTVEPHYVGHVLRKFIGDCMAPTVIADSPVDIGRFCQAISTGVDGGWASADYAEIRFIVRNVDCYPTLLEGAVHHNAWWDAMALRALAGQGETP